MQRKRLTSHTMFVPFIALPSCRILPRQPIAIRRQASVDRSVPPV
jgi:hypothetical protein